MSNLTTLLGIENSDMEYINMLIEDMKKLNDKELISRQKIYNIVHSAYDTDEIVSNLIGEIIYVTMKEFLSKTIEYAEQNKEKNIDFLKDIKIRVFEDGKDSWADFIVEDRTYIPYKEVISMEPKEAIKFFKKHIQCEVAKYDRDTIITLVKLLTHCQKVCNISMPKLIDILETIRTEVSGCDELDKYFIWDCWNYEFEIDDEIYNVLFYMDAETETYIMYEYVHDYFLDDSLVNKIIEKEYN